jgi:hypothetical protein
MCSEALRLRGILLVAALAAWLCGSTIALGQGAAPPAQSVTPTQLDQLMERINGEDAEAARHLPVNYHECLLPVLLDQMEGMAGREGLHVYVSVFGLDMDAQLQALLAKHGVIALPLSALTNNPPEPSPSDTGQHTSNWSFFAARLIAEPLGQYSVDAGYHCGSLCAGVFHYTFRIVGKTCSITSKDMRWVS